MPRLYGRQTVVRNLAERLRAGETVLFYGPVGSGKSTALDRLAYYTGKQHRPYGFCRPTRSLRDITEALLAAYPDIRHEGRTQRQIRHDLSSAIENRPGTLLLDHFSDVGTQLKGYLRSLRGTGLGVLWVADAETPRDHERLRAMRLAYQEINIPPLPSRIMHRILADRLAAAGPLPFSLPETDRIALIRMARGRPGWIVMICDLLRRPRFWDDGRVLKAPLKAEIISKIAGMYFHGPEGMA